MYKSIRVLLLTLFLTSSLLAVGKYDATIDHQLRRALVTNSEQSDRAVQELRQSGPLALNQMLRHRDALLAAINKSAEEDASNKLRERLARLENVIDRVGGQKYCSASKLFWYTDIERAKAVAKSSGKPILSLRLLGKLTDEFSCANSRFFRTTLYANNTISKKLQEQFVLHWKSVRPVPRVTIDFGDGRKLERTLTGNSIHYVLDSSGQTIDALPGLYGPKAFIERLDSAHGAWKLLAQSGEENRRNVLYVYHLNRLSEIQKNWARDLATAKLSVNAQVPGSPNPPQLAQAGAAPRAEVAAKVARPKALVEIPMLNAINARFVKLDSDTNDALWAAIANLHHEEATLDGASITLIKNQNPNAFRAGQLAITKRVTENPILRLVGSLQSSIAVDTVRNEYQLHRKIHEWFVSDNDRPADVDKLNERVYAELFLTPSSDPWLGLVSRDTYTALENNGIVSAETR